MCEAVCRVLYDPFVDDDTLSSGIGGDRGVQPEGCAPVFAVGTGRGTEVSNLTTDC